MKTKLLTIASGLLIFLFSYAAASKLLIYDSFRGQLHQQHLPYWLAEVLWYTLPPLELILSGLLCFPRTRRAGLWLATGLLTVFSAYISLVLLHAWTRVPCSCGGILSHLSWGHHLLLNLGYLLLALYTLFLTSGRKQGKAENP